LDQKISHDLSSFLVVLGQNVLGEKGDICTNLSQVFDGIFSNGLGEIEWVLEDLRPDLNSHEIIFGHLAGSKFIWKFGNDLSHHLDTHENTGKVLLFEVSKSCSDLSGNSFSICETVVNVIEVILLDNSHNESTNKLFGSFDGHL